MKFSIKHSVSAAVGPFLLIWPTVASSDMKSYYFPDESGQYASASPPFSASDYWPAAIWVGGLFLAAHIKKKNPENYWVMPLAWFWPILMAIIAWVAHH